MQQYAEVLVRAHKTEKTARAKGCILAFGALLILGIVALTAYLMGLFPAGTGWSVLPFALLLCLLVAWGVLCALDNLHIEYEYAISDASITIDRIRAKKRRKQVLHLPLAQVTAFGEAKQPVEASALDMTGTPAQNGTWYLDYRTENGPVRLLLCPNAAGLEILQRALRRVTVREGWQ